jgi:hypothetical protein
MTSRRAALAICAAAGLALYLWPAVQAPPVLWADSDIDLDWARRGIGIFSAVPSGEQLAAGVHQAKPLYLLFLRCAIALAPASRAAQAVVILQSLLLCLVILWVSFRGRGTAIGTATCVVLLGFLRLRDSASSVMSEPLTAALLLVAARGFLVLPETWQGAGALGAAIGTLFWVRPNAGAVALVLVAARYLLKRRFAAGWPAAAAFLLIVMPIAIATRPGAGGPALRGLAFPLLVGSTDYAWAPAVAAIETSDQARRQSEEVRRARENWRRLGQSLSRADPDAQRQLAWRAAHGLFGTEFYDASWSPVYRALTSWSRLFTPILTLASLALLLALPFRGEDRSLNAVGPLLVAMLLAQNLVLGSLPRYDLPFLPLLFVLAVMAAGSLRDDRRRTILAASLFVILMALVVRCRYLLDWEWGRIESAGVTLSQRVARASLPRTAPATLHIRIGSAAQSTGTALEVLGPRDQPLLSSSQITDPRRPALEIPLPQWILDENQKDAIEIRIRSTGSYGPFSFCLFPVIPAPWAGAAHRFGSEWLSPSTGIRAGSLDWWAHPGSDPPRPDSEDARHSASMR